MNYLLKRLNYEVLFWPYGIHLINKEKTYENTTHLPVNLDARKKKFYFY